MTPSLEQLGLLAHGVHYGLVVGGVLGVSWLLVPTLTAPRSSGTSAPADEHEARVLAVRAALAAGTPTHSSLAVAALPVAPARPRVPVTAASSLHLPLAVVCSTAAAGVHAAMGPAHFDQATLFGAFFALAALAQLGWTAAAATRCTHRLLTLGVALNLGCVALWALTRVVGLPLGLMPEPEPVGGWDLAALVWELAVVGACLAMLRTGSTARKTPRLAAFADWQPSARAVAAASPVALAVLTLVGANG